MAIDMLENNEMGALAPSRLGMKNFVNDTPIKGKKMPKMEENFAELFGSKKRKKFVASVKSSLGQLPTDCDSIDNSIAVVEAETAALIKRSATEKGRKLKFTNLAIQENQSALGELKKIKSVQCAELEKEKKAKEEAAFEEKLLSLSEQAVEKSKEEAEGIGAKVKANKTILLIGGGVIALGVIGYFLFRKK